MLNFIVDLKSWVRYNQQNKIMLYKSLSILKKNEINKVNHQGSCYIYYQNYTDSHRHIYNTIYSHTNNHISNITHNGIDTPTQLIVKSIIESYKTKNFNKIQWQCMYNDVIKNKNKFHIKQVVTIINVLGHMHIGKQILLELKPVILSKINDTHALFIIKIFISYIKANIIDCNFFERLYLILQNNTNDVPYTSLINLVFHINFYFPSRKNILLKMQEDAFVRIVKQLSKHERETKKCKEKKDNENKNEIENELITREDSEYDIKEKHRNLIHNYNYSCELLEIFQQVLVFYSISNYLFHFYLKKEKNENNSVVNQLIVIQNVIETCLQKKNVFELTGHNIFYLFLVYKGCLNNIYTFSVSNTNIKLFQYVKQELQNFILNHLEKEEQHKKGHINKLIKYIDILKNNIIFYFENEKKHFQFYFETNIFFIKKFLYYLQEKNKNDMKKYYIWHREKIEDIQKLLRQIEVK